jgi:RHS repeat-associated protein
LESYAYLGLGTVVTRSHPQSGVNQTYIIAGGNSDGGDQYTGLDRFGRVVEDRWVNTSNSTITDDFLYTYDRDGNRLTRSNGLNSSFNEQYGYDNLNQLTSFSRGTSHSQSWSLDAVGNWTSFTSDSSTQTRTDNVQNQITSISGATTPTYDNNGNTTTDQTGNTYTYDAWNRLVKAVSGSNSVGYTVDPLARRISSALNSGTATDFYYSAAWQVLEEQVSGSMTAQYVWSPAYVDALVERDTSSRLYAQQDANWNVTAIVDATGAVQERYAYDPYGKSTDGNGNPAVLTPSWGSRATSLFAWTYLHQGGRYDNTSGLYNFRNRDYSPTLGRWMQQDPAGYAAGDSNLYCYVHNGPVQTADATGLYGSRRPGIMLDPSITEPQPIPGQAGDFFGSFVIPFLLAGQTAPCFQLHATCNITFRVAIDPAETSGSFHRVARAEARVIGNKEPTHGGIVGPLPAGPEDTGEQTLAGTRRDIDQQLGDLSVRDRLEMLAQGPDVPVVNERGRFHQRPGLPHKFIETLARRSSLQQLLGGLEVRILVPGQ